MKLFAIMAIEISNCVKIMKQGEQTRNKILESSNKLFYHHGFHQTAFSDIVNATGLSKGNITYHFKSKDDILLAVIEKRIKKTESALSSWDKKYPDPVSRLNHFIDSLLDGKSELIRYGCPNGTLACELGKSDALTRELSQQIFDRIRHWLTNQFIALDFSAQQSSELAMQMFTRAQGICVLSQVYNDENFFEHQLQQLRQLITPQKTQ